MAPSTKRRRTTGPQTASNSNQQGTLSFRSSKAGLQRPQARDGKPTKSSQAIESKGEAEARDINPEDVQSEASAQIETNAVGSEEEDDEHAVLYREALTMAEAKLKGYWAAKEEERKAPRVHQQGLSVREKILREFDMSSRFGPSVGIQRLARWWRANDLGMQPPIEVLAVLVKEEAKIADSRASTKRDVQTSIIDELTLSSRLKGDVSVEA